MKKKCMEKKKEKENRVFLRGFTRELNCSE